MHADDVKLFSSFTLEFLSSLFQSDLDNFVRWCSQNFMTLKKYNKFSFSRNTPFTAYYFIHSLQLENIDSFKVLGVLFNYRLRFNLHIDFSLNQAESVFGVRNLGWNALVSLLPYENRLLLFTLYPLEKRRFIRGVFFLITLINGTINLPTLLVGINVNVTNGFSRNSVLLESFPKSK